jgi:hypothetical protein
MTLERYLRHRRRYEAAAWLIFFAAQLAANGLVQLLDVRRMNSGAAAWEPFMWEYSSGLLILALLPALLAFERRFPLQRGVLLRNGWRHALATVPFSLLHVGGMVLLRKLVYALDGQHYGFAAWEWFYEYLKDARSYVTLLGIVYLYRFVLIRLQGEASLLAAPDAGPPVEPVERPERFLVRKLGREFLIAAVDIERLEAAENYVNLHLRGHVYPLRSTMAAIEKRLDPARFVRVHRSHIVNLEHLAEIQPLDTGDALLLMRDGQRVPCSRRYRAALRASGEGMREPALKAAS